MSIRFKLEEYGFGLRPEILLGAIKVEPIFAYYQVDLIITSGREKYKHSVERSAHYRGDAIDVRSKNLPISANKIEVLNRIKDILGPDYVCVFENAGKANEHFHIHWSPVYKD